METLQQQQSIRLTGGIETEKAIDLVKTTFSDTLCRELNLTRVVAPLIVAEDTGINDDLNGIERPVQINIKDMQSKRVTVVQSLAKWKRYRLAQLGAEPGEGILTDMKALRPDEDLGPLHSVYVDQWDWEKVISGEQRHLLCLKDTVKRIYKALVATEKAVAERYQEITPVLPPGIKFIHAEDLYLKYPELTPRERETEAAREYGAFFLTGIGGDLPGGNIHDGRAPDYDDWSTPTGQHYRGLNGDIIVWNPVTGSAFEISSMGIRVDESALVYQLEKRNCLERRELMFHRMLLGGKLPQTMGGGIGQSRVCMFMLRKSHIGQVQASVWPETMTEELKKESIDLI
ncbi:MAG: aspartate--ammonia ligase [Marinilabiliales bacterium]|nr:MAG: aspartate--ammonia ligase [Marinilabiliales bacterium]